jgi:hypothetical protein
LTLVLVPRDTQWRYYGFDGSEVVTIHVFDTITDAMKRTVSPGKTEDAEVVDPLDCWGDVVMLPDINGSISYFTLETRGGGKSKWDIVINVE